MEIDLLQKYPPAEADACRYESGVPFLADRASATDVHASGLWVATTGASLTTGDAPVLLSAWLGICIRTRSHAEFRCMFYAILQ